MSNVTSATRMISTNRNIRQRCQLKYSKYGIFNWDKWTEYDCIFCSFIDVNGIQQNQLELHSKYNIHEPNGKIIDLRKLRSVTSIHGDINKNEPKNIIILKINGKRHRFGFDNIYEYNQWKTLLDGVYNSSWDLINKDRPDENTTVNMLYESATAMRYRVHFTDLATQEILSLPSGVCELIVDTDKIVLEQHHDKQYTFPRSTIRTIRLINDRDIEFELGTRAPVQGFIRFRFESSIDARSCYLQWNEGITTAETSYRESREHLLTRHKSQKTGCSVPPPHIPLQQEYSHQSFRAPRNLLTRSSYYNMESSAINIPQNEYTAFQTLV
ncbi:unnamed protein product [Rotaria sordida]|uniref:IRS-type PTB domain-containing protein n=2 Tax=Rotaria sordida TaxID=392033 RepID=A0A818YW01_9BILA|nr:unnamed protein product [Rotaria sordida]CAF0924962.1 unnamed protein product [Rotaria sordida]CAF1008091.1 unnamed protein product [Rotaria sordida]CAF3707452.1 unnamed protein product [Rotaria sordida]CAF3755510.1 unnamed protein product [Rotaria sordida]